MTYPSVLALAVLCNVTVVSALLDEVTFDGVATPVVLPSSSLLQSAQQKNKLTLIEAAEVVASERSAIGPVAVGGAALAGSSSSSMGAAYTPDELKETWRKYLEEPPERAVKTTDELLSRAETLVATLPDKISVTGDVDVSISGGGNLDAFAIGVYSVLARVPSIRMLRFSGSSAGSQLAFELVLKGERVTVDQHFAYGVLQEEWPMRFGNSFTGGIAQGSMWPIKADWLVKEWNAAHSALVDDTVYIALNCLQPLPTLVLVSKYPTKELAWQAWKATGTVSQTYDGMSCSDGGATSGNKMTPLFGGPDGTSTRDQIIVDLMETGGPWSMLTHYDVKQYLDLAKHGQDEAITFLKTGRTDKRSVALCPSGSPIVKFECEAAV